MLGCFLSLAILRKDVNTYKRKSKSKPKTKSSCYRVEFSGTNFYFYGIIPIMRVISRRTLKEFWEKHAGAEAVLKTWYTRVKRAEWKTPFDVKVDY